MPTSPTNAPPTEENVVFRGQALKQVQDAADVSGVSVQEFVRYAISLRLWADDVLADGGEVIFKRKHGQSEVLRRKK